MSVPELQTEQGMVMTARAIASIDKTIEKLQKQRHVLVQNLDEYMRKKK